MPPADERAVAQIGFPDDPPVYPPFRFCELTGQIKIVSADQGISGNSNGANTPASVKVRAAEAIFNHAAKAIEIEDIEARVAALEAAAANGQERR